MARRPIESIPTPPSSTDEVYEEFVRGFRSRKFSAGLLTALIDMFLHMGTPARHLENFQSFEAVYPPLELNRRGAANTLTVNFNGTQLTLRRFYDLIETSFRATHHRMDYPNCAPHATQAWNEMRYRPWLDVLVSSSEHDLRVLRQRVVDFVLEKLPDHSTFDAAERARPDLFRLALTGFDMSAQAEERTGAPFQGMVFAFLRADNPHLQVTASRVRSGGARHGAIGDVDAWDGTHLALSAEVKHKALSKKDIEREITDFAGRIRQKAALGLVVALSFDDEAVEAVAELGLLPVSLNDLINQVSLWEAHKHALAVRYAEYYFLRSEMSAPLTQRFLVFIARAIEHFGNPEAADNGLTAEDPA